MMNRFNFAFFSCGAALCATLCGCSKHQNTTTGSAPVSTDSTSGPVEMKLKWTVGKAYDEKMSIKRTTQLNLPGMSKPENQDFVADEDFTISVLKSLPDGGTELGMEFTGQKLSIKQGSRVQLDFDSSRDPQDDKRNAVSPLLRKIIGSRLKVELDSDGKATDVVGYSDLISQISGGKPQIEATLKQLVDKEALKQMVMRGQGLPPGPVKIGDHWPVHLEMETTSVGTLVLDMKYNFRGWQEHEGHRCAVMEFVGDISSKAGTSSDSNGAQVSIDKGTMDGTTWYDPESSMIVENASTEDMAIKIALNGKNYLCPTKQSMSFKIVQAGDIAQ